jgi:hypothetical protein
MSLGLTTQCKEGKAYNNECSCGILGMPHPLNTDTPCWCDRLAVYDSSTKQCECQPNAIFPYDWSPGSGCQCANGYTYDLMGSCIPVQPQPGEPSFAERLDSGFKILVQKLELPLGITAAVAVSLVGGYVLWRRFR